MIVSKRPLPTRLCGSGNYIAHLNSMLSIVNTMHHPCTKYFALGYSSNVFRSAVVRSPLHIVLSMLFLSLIDVNSLHVKR